MAGETLVRDDVRSGKLHVVALARDGGRLPLVAGAPQLLERLLPSVVGISNQLASGSTPNCANEVIAGGVAFDEGTGVVLSAGGEVLTNNHVVAGGTRITVTLEGDGGTFPASLIGSDPADDLALLQVHGAPALVAASLGDSAAVQVGAGVLAVGNALGLSLSAPSASEGILSAKGRIVSAAVSCTDETLVGMLQTDAAINPGNSGGPLVDSQGRVIGIDTAGATSFGQAPAQRVGFAIPIDEILALLPALRRGGAIGQPKAFFGVEAESLTAALRSEFGYTPTSGALVDSLVPGSPGSQAGLEPGDVIVSFGGAPVTSAGALAALVVAARPGTDVRVGFFRGAVRMSVAVQLGVAPAPA
jgi:S1-C subfamily serine protease